jgi:hypothetical protein
LYFVFMYSTYLASTAAKNYFPIMKLKENLCYTGTVFHFKIILTNGEKKILFKILSMEFGTGRIFVFVSLGGRFFYD